jgi:uncharacterized protein (DUF983 family)
VDRARVSLALRRALGLRCPRCGSGPLFTGLVRMPARCPVCGLVSEREAGYFIGAIYINYGLTVLLALGGYFALEAWLAPSPRWQVAVWGAFVVLFPLWSFRYSKALWLALDHLVDPTRAGGEPGSSGPGGPP